MTALVLALILLLVLSGVFSSMETSLATLNKAKIKAIFGLKKLKIFRDWLIRPSSVFSTILIGNNFVNIAFSSILSFSIITALVADGVSTEVSSLLAIVATSALILFFGEILPKNIATTYPRKVSETFGGFLNFIGFILTPFTELITAVSNRIVGFKAVSADLRIDRFDISELSMTIVHADVGALPGTGGVDAFSKSISKVLSMSQMTVGRIMTPRKEIEGIDLNMDWEKIRERIIESGISRFPSYYGSLKNLAGILYTREICNALILERTIDLKQYVHKPFYIDESDNALNAYRKMVKNRVHIAVVVNEKFKIRGIITMEDLLEEIFGPILDEYDLKPK